MLKLSINICHSEGTKCFEYLTEKVSCLIKICMINERDMVEGLPQFCVKGKYENVATGVLRVKVLGNCSVLCVPYQWRVQRFFLVECKANCEF
jgi:hypothetical protein